MNATVRMLALCAGVHAACGPPPERTDTPPAVDSALAELGAQFISSTADVNGTTLRYVRGGSGPPVILLHGFPRDWSVFHRIMPRLARSFTVVATDLRGVGRSAATQNGYDAASLAEDVYQLARHLGWRSRSSRATTTRAWSPTRWFASILRQRAA